MSAVVQHIINLRKQDTYYQTTMGPSAMNNGGDNGGLLKGITGTLWYGFKWQHVIPQKETFPNSACDYTRIR